MGIEKVPPKVIELLQKLRERTTDKGFTEGEMEASAAKIRSLLHEYQISLMDVAERSTDSLNAVRGDFQSSYVRMPDHVIYFAVSIAEAFGTKLITGYWRDENKKRRTRLSFIGLESDVEVSIFFYAVLGDKLYEMCSTKARERKIARGELSAYHSSFFRSASDILKDRLSADAKKDASTSKGGELVLLKDAKIEECIAKEFPVLGRGKELNLKSHWDGHYDGQAAGRDVGIHRGVGESGAKTPKALS